MSNNQSNDGAFLFMFLFVLIWGIGWLVWNSFRPQLTEGMLTVRRIELKVADIWMDDDDIIKVPYDTAQEDDKGFDVTLGDPGQTNWKETTFGQWKRYAEKATAETMSTDHIKVLSYVTLHSMRFLFGVIFLGLFIWALFRGPTSLFHRVMGLEKLMADQAKTFKVIKPFLKFNPNTLPIRPPGSPVPTEMGMFAEALGPEEWLAVEEIPMTGNMPDRIAAEKAFAKQLGPRWKGANDLPNELKILLAAFCLKASRQRNEADEMLGRLSCCWDHETGLKLSRDSALLREAKKILGNKKLAEKTLANCNRHAYVSTAMMRALNTAREEGGVLAPAQFVWLRAHNRALWYPLNNLGRQAFHMESLGVCAHYRAEKQINRPIPKPRVMDAVDGLIEFQQNPVMVRPLPAVDYGKSGKKPKNKAA